MLLFASNFSLPAKALFRFQKLFASFRFKAKRNKRFFALFRFEAKRNRFFFASFHFTRYRLEKLKDPALIFFFVSLKSIPEFNFILFRFEVFASFSLCFRFVLFSFRFRCENKLKTFFWHRGEKKFQSKAASSEYVSA